MSSRWTMLALCSLASLVVASAICFVSSGSEHVIGVDETIGAIPRSLADADVGMEGHTASGAVGRTSSEVLQANEDSARNPLRLIVLERGTRQPVPGATVAVWADPTGDHDTVRYYGRWIGPDFSQFISSHGVTLTTDAQGSLDLQRDGHDLYVAARSNELFGLLEIRSDESGPLQLEIAPSHDVDVVVRDACGRPCAGVGVGVSACRDYDAFWADVTDANGHCRIHDFETIVDQGVVKSGDAVAIRLDVAAAPAIERWVDPVHVPTEPIVLIAPPTGTVRIRLVDGSGRVLAVDGELQIGVNDDGVPGSVRPFVSSSSMRVALRAGHAVAEHVTLNRQLWISADLDGREDPSCDIEGPKFPGETVDAALAMEDYAVLVRGRALDANGAPLCDAALDWSDIFDDGRKFADDAGGCLRTSADGSFVWTMRRASEADELQLRRTCRLYESNVGSKHRECALPIPLEIRGDVLDVGDVNLAPIGPLVCGRVVDQNGRGVRNVRVETVLLSSKDPSRRGEGEFDPELDAVENDSSTATVWTSADGSFAFFGPDLGMRRAVNVMQDGGETTRIVPFACGSQSKPLVIVIRAPGTVHGTVLVDSDWNSDDFRVKFVSDGIDEAKPLWGPWWLDGDHVCFRIESPVSARGRVEFKGDDSQASPALVVEGIDILSGSDSSPSSLVDVDLRGKLPRRAKSTKIELEIVDVGGRPIPSGIAWIWSGENAPEKIGWAEGHARIADKNVKAVEVWAPGHCFSVVHEPAQTVRVVLRPEIELEIALTLPSKLRDPAITLSTMLRYKAAEDDAMSPHAFDGDSAIDFDVAHKAHVRVSASGWYGVEVTLTRRIGPETEDDDGTLNTEILQWFQVRNMGGVQTLTFAPDAEERQAALSYLGLTKE